MKRPPTQSLQIPEQASRIVRDIIEAIEAGELAQLPDSIGVERLQQIAEGQPWPADFIEVNFEEPTTGKRFRLSLETYHGTGGAWQEV